MFPSEIGMDCFTQRTQTIMHSRLITPYYNVYGYNNGLGINARYRLNNKWSLKLFYHYAKLINTYDIALEDPVFFRRDRNQYKPFSYYWISNEIGIGFKYKFYSKNNSELFFEQSLCTNYGQLLYEHFPFNGLYSDSMTRDITYQNGIPAKLTYNILQVSVRNMGLNLLNGITYQRKLSSNLKINLNFTFNSGFIPLIGTRIDYTITSDQRKGSVIGQHYATSSNSGLRLGFGINYVIKKDKPKLQQYSQQKKGTKPFCSVPFAL